MRERVIKHEFIEQIRLAWDEWNGLVQSIDRHTMQLSGFCGAWFLKDVIAHITWYEREMVNMFKAHALVGSIRWELPTDQRNALIFEEHKDLSLEQVLAQSQEVFAELIGQLESLSEDDLNDPARFPGMPLDWQPWQVIASNTHEHYQAHMPQARAWLGK